MIRYFPVVLPAVLCATWLLKPTMGASPISVEDVRYCSVRLTARDSLGHAVPGARLWGYSSSHGLVWPRFANPQYFKPWEDPPEAFADVQGNAVATVPKGEWVFVAFGVCAGEKRRFYCGASPVTNVSADMNVTVSASRSLDVAPPGLAGEGGHLRSLLLRSGALAVWTPVALGRGPEAVPFACDCNEGDEAVCAVEDAAGSGVCVTQSALRNEADATSAQKTRGLAEVVFVQKAESPKPTRLLWERDRPGFLGVVELAGVRVVRFTPGRYLLSYECVADDGRTVRFGPGWLNLSPSAPTHFIVGGAYAAGIQEDYVKPFVRGGKPCPGHLTGILAISDNQGLVAWHVLGADHRDVNLSGKLIYDGKRSPVTQNGPMYFSIPDADAEQAAASKRRQWEIVTPLASLIGKSFPAQSPTIRVRSACFHAETIEPLRRTTQHFLVQADGVTADLGRVCGKARTRNTELMFGVTGSPWATHAAEKMYLGFDTLQFPLPSQTHSVAHETTHGFGFYHGPLMELVVEIGRCHDGPQVTAQVPKWLFFDRLNHRRESGGIPERWRDGGRDAPLGLYFHLYNRTQGKAVKLLVTKESEFFRIADKKGIPRPAAMAAITSRAMNTDILPLWVAYGYKIDAGAYESARRALRDLLDGLPRQK